MSGWGCPHEWDGKCLKVAERPCDPGMKGCVLAGRFEFANEEKNRPVASRRREERGLAKKEGRSPRDGATPARVPPRSDR